MSGPFRDLHQIPDIRFDALRSMTRAFKTSRRAARSSRCPVPSWVEQFEQFPKTRYQGSKRKFAVEIVRRAELLEVDTVLDAFGGAGSVAYAFKCAGKTVTYNDVLAFNHQIGLSLIENHSTHLDEKAIKVVGVRKPERDYEDVIESTFSDIYFTDEENRWLDVAVQNIRSMRGRMKRSLAWYALFQAAMAKRPYNLFHRRNLYMRTADVSRSFGNKATWDRSFESHFEAAVALAHRAVFRSSAECSALCKDVMDIRPDFDLVYIDPPYINRNGVGVKYRNFYHFLEGMMHYDQWPALIDMRSRHRRLQPVQDPWASPTGIGDQFKQLFDYYRGSHLVVSYRSDGIPSIEELSRLLKGFKRRVQVVPLGHHQYALSTQEGTQEMLLMGTD